MVLVNSGLFCFFCLCSYRLALQRLLGGGDDLVANLGTQQGYSVRQVIEAVQAVTGRTVPTRLAGRRPGDPPVLVADATRARELLGWLPQYPDLHQQVIPRLTDHNRWAQARMPMDMMVQG